jgi:selenocysteine-specific elongation factor
MKNIIAGTAGHIDHGKTALVKALTGIDADRLEEEKRRGITIDLGFAHLELPGGIVLGFVDVPGHERFIKNMLAGVGGIDLLLFVIAADESIKPQTREHFDICRLLGIRRGIIALTKCDLVDEDILGLVRLEVEEMVAGSFLQGAPIVPVSSVTGAGLDLLRAELAAAASTVEEKNSAGYFRLPIDRVFTVKGFGTVATGTLISGSVTKEQDVDVYPSGRRLRVRGVQVHGSTAGRARAGQRTAVNLADIEPAELTRGDVLSEPGRFQAVTQVDCRLDLLASAKPLKHRAPVHFHSGTAEIEAEVRMLESTAAMRPGTTSFVRLMLRRPALLLPGDAFIIRMFSPVITIGGGVVVDTGGVRYRKGSAPQARLETLHSGDTAARIALLVRETSFGAGMATLIARTALSESEITKAAAQAPLTRIAQPQPWYVDRAWMQSERDRVGAALRDFHREFPLVPGMARQELRGKAPVFVFDAVLESAKDIVSEGEIVRLRSHKVVLKEDEEQARLKIERAFESAGLAVPALPEVLAASGVEPARARSILQILIREKRLVRIKDDLVFHHTAIAGLHKLLADHKGQRFKVPEFKDWTNISRKYAIPLLEFLDREKITRREADDRVVL